MGKKSYGGDPFMLKLPITGRVAGLDSLRSIAAIWVLFNHIGTFPMTNGLDKGHPVGLMVHAIYGNLFAGPPAVFVFFVISGFCIHYCYWKQQNFQLLPYLTRRYIRIGIPLLVAILLATPLAVNLRLFQNSILWSLVAELIYYALYPVLRKLGEKFGWNRLLVFAFLGAIGAIILHPTAQDYSPYGNGLNWIIGLPCWLLGCKLAEVVVTDAPSDVSRSRIWSMRLFVWFLSSVSSVLRFHSPIGYPWTLLGFGIPVFIWLRMEIQYFRKTPPLPIFEWVGRWSYSIYLIHLVAAAAYQFLPLPNLGFNLNWSLKFMIIFFLSYIFFLVVEKPSHLLASRLSRLVQKARPEGQSASVTPLVGTAK